MSGNLNWRWIGIGVAIMFALNLVASLLMAFLIGPELPAPDATPEEAAATLGGGQIALAALVGIASFAIGGYIVGLKSPGRTVLEPGISAAIAVLITLLVSGAFTLGTLIIGGLLPFLAGVLGGYLGEKRQGTAATPAR